MISRITGTIAEKGQNYLLLDLNGISYQVFIPTCVLQGIDDSAAGQKISLLTYHYLQVEQARSFPVLIGFLNQVEKDFFEIFITVSGIGPRAALRALNKPISSIAKAIDEGDLASLKSLPGIGEQRAKEIIAKLQNKVGKFGLIQDHSFEEEKTSAKDISEEALEVLLQLEYKRSEAAGMIKKVLEGNPRVATTEELLNLVYKQKRSYR
ncbi:MAG: Holliday junction ATP-dependent DNA helicase RuvA [Candidatus Omnitrophica bacterium]|jgi:Holliday junction DNA helicase RuvA|nr:Holliday junction branch migration protein RuvA [Candidatus Omnitrophota bacterium]MDD3274804.1 Holliday junction ATP-dependent DNA helicase RuvA [Candidatus Omnitrophota bacterium]MDD5077668.1 Holliday junction ATP-dependent DNA helicase RuvA [Candidatus Omnitrophota bacterium]MDD5725146.1 Holliday junction ATP-dependent DNA helicase RuvA [Candidatus Omnitrophota bacterium]